MPCQCGKKSKCKTNRCECVRLNGKCLKECSCSEYLCENKNLSSSNERVQNSKLLDSNEISFQIHGQLECSVTRKRQIVLEYRNGIDLYTGDKEGAIIDPHVDHIIETQMLTKAVADTLKRPLKTNLVQPLKDSINQNDNYNVTHGRINISKGGCIKSFLNDGFYKDYPLRAVVIGKYCEKYIKPISDVMLYSHDFVDNSIRSARQEGYVTGNNDFNSIADTLLKIIEKMDLSPEDSMILRSSTKTSYCCGLF